MDEGAGFVGLLIMGGLIWGGYTIYHQNEMISQLRDTVGQCSSTIDEANSNIDDLNSTITDAQAEAWSDYDTMGSTLEDMQTGDTVSNDCYDPTKS